MSLKLSKCRIVMKTGDKPNKTSLKTKREGVIAKTGSGRRALEPLRCCATAPSSSPITCFLQLKHA